MDQTETSISGEPAAPQHVGIAIRAMIFGALLGTSLISLAMWGVRTLQAGGPPGEVARGPAFALGVGGTFAGLGVAVGVAWSLMRPLRSPYRRVGLAILAGFLTLLAMLPTVLLDQLVGAPGLLGFAAACVAGCALLSRKVATGIRAS